MGYRKEDIPPLKPENALPMFEVRNGAWADIAFPCYYLDVHPAHDRDIHDFFGYPNPRHPDRSCQEIGAMPHHEHIMFYEWIDFFHPHPIDLTSEEEGYEEAAVILDEPTEGLTLRAEIDDVETNVVMLHVSANLEFFEDKPIERRFTLFVRAGDRMDQVVRGVISVLPGRSPLREEEE